MRHDVGKPAWLDLYQTRLGDDATMNHINWLIESAQAFNLWQWLTTECPDTPNFLDPREPPSHNIGLMIASIERNHPEWITHKAKPSQGGRRRSKQHTASKPLTKKIG